MFKKVILAVSLLANCLTAYVIFQPASAATISDRMTCDQARSEVENKKAVSAYSKGRDLAKVHGFLRNSDYALRNVSIRDGKVAFVYTSQAFYPSSCGLHLPGIDGGIVRIETDIAAAPHVVSVW